MRCYCSASRQSACWKWLSTPYAGVLGLRLVKMTVNYDDPTTYHLCYGDGQGHPGTMTFFPWPCGIRVTTARRRQ
jgi:catechol 2,3-dioxygenase-like lactoylglutathione lyase family enzyme